MKDDESVRQDCHWAVHNSPARCRDGYGLVGLADFSKIR